MMGPRGEAGLLQRQGQILYGQGSWDAAVSAFSEALKCPDVDALSVLDNRAATYTKLLRYDQALKDAKQMIKQNKQDERGYLRCAKALLLDGKPEKALEVYAYALKTISKDNPRRQVMEQMHTKLHAKLVSNNYDPFTVFPLEIARMVLEHFDFKQIVAILRVSKGWDRFLTSVRDLWLRIDFTNARSKIHWSSALSYIRRSKATLTAAIVTNLTKASIRKVLEYLSRCPNLQHLEIHSPSSAQDILALFKSSKNLQVLLISAETTIPQSITASLLTSLPNLQRLEIHRSSKTPSAHTTWPSSLPNLRSITLGTTESGVPQNYTPALYIPRQIDPSTPLSIANLTELRLHSNPEVFVLAPPTFNPADLPNLKKLDISGLYMSGDFGLPPTLEFLRIRGGAAAEALPFAFTTPDPDPYTEIAGTESAASGNVDSQNQPPFHLPALTTLILSDVPWATPLTLASFLLSTKPTLRILHIDSCFRVTAIAFIEILRQFEYGSGRGFKIETLNLAHIMGVDDASVSMVVMILEGLRVLNISFTDVTGVAIKAAVGMKRMALPGDGIAGGLDGPGGGVECVYVKGCENISSDAIDYGRSKGLVIVT
ncbi:hypothetical protein BJY04DRAFT_196144 [Aspergillus karnatakaensis]|uniref:Leucine Rich Repeat domain protein n=1 Tax=Aspergillus karnatakaensis TaxID=1810916 RepID=UPI003CCD7FF4